MGARHRQQSETRRGKPRAHCLIAGDSEASMIAALWIQQSSRSRARMINERSIDQWREWRVGTTEERGFWVQSRSRHPRPARFIEIRTAERASHHPVIC